jgi:hypothetical protein
MKLERKALILLCAILLLCSCQKESGDLTKKDLMKIFSSGVYFIASSYEIKDRDSLDRSIRDLYANEQDIPITSTQIKKVSDFDEKNGAYYAEMDIQAETSRGISINAWKLTLQKGVDGSNHEYYRLFLFRDNADRRLTIYKDILPQYIAEADGISLHFHKAKSIIN